MEPIETMTKQQAFKKYGENYRDRTTSQRCPHCKELVFNDDFVGEPEVPTLVCPSCETTIINKFYTDPAKKDEPVQFTAKQVEYLKLRYRANEKLLEALKAAEILNEALFLGKVQPVTDPKKAELHIQSECAALRKIFMDSGL